MSLAAATSTHPANPFSPPSLQRRQWVAGLGALALLSACAHPVSMGDRIVEVASGDEWTRTELLAALRASDYVLLGELHDNPHHHQRRGDLIVDLGPDVVVVAEHLPLGARVATAAEPPAPAQVAAGAALRARLEAMGFDATAWRWPLHQALFAPVLAAGVPLLGGNAAQSLVRQSAREGPAAWPLELRQRLEAASLDAAQQLTLDQALVEGHCGQLSAARLPGMRAAQRLRDASMALALQSANGRPSVLVAGNGHARLDHGVGQLLRQLEPAARVLSVGFGEPGSVVVGAPYTHLWITPGVRRGDPCAGFRLPPPRPG